MEELFDIHAWIDAARERLGELSNREALEEERFIYDDIDQSGQLYWWVDESVACCPVYSDGQLDLENIRLVDGEEHGAEYDLYGRECLIVAALAERFGNEPIAESFRDRAIHHFQRAEAEDCMYWEPSERPPVGP